MDRTTSENYDATGLNCGNSTSLQTIHVTAPSLVAVNQDLKWFFPLHTYGFACLFFVLGFYTLFTIINLRSLISSRPFMTTINVFLCVLGVSRSGCLFIDPYNLQETMPKVFGSIMWDIGFPCVTSAFCLVRLAFLQLTQLKFGPEKLQNEKFLSIMIAAHFSGIIAVDTSFVMQNHYMEKYSLQILLLGWSLLLYLIFLRSGYKVMHLLKTLPNNLLTRESSLGNQKGIMQLAMLAPYNNLATSVAAALVPTLLNPKMMNEDNELGININDDVTNEKAQTSKKEPIIFRTISEDQPTSTVPEVYVRPPTPTPSMANLPIITVSSPSRRNSVANSRRGSDASKGSRRNSECSVRFINEEGISPTVEQRSSSPINNRPKTPEGILRRHSDMPITPTGSNKDLRRCSDFTHEKNRSSQFAMKLRRNSDFGNRTPKRLQGVDEEGKLPKVLDVSPAGSRRNSDLGGLSAVKAPESRRNSDISYRRNSDLAQMRPLNISRRSSEVSIRTLDKSPPHFQTSIQRIDIQERSESDSDQPDQPDCNEKAALMTDNLKDKENETKHRKKSLTWKNVECEDTRVASSLLGDRTLSDSTVVGTDFTLHAILNHIAYVNRAKSDIPLYIPEENTGAIRKNQIKRVLNVTYATAVLGIFLCITDFISIIGPYGLLAENVIHGTLPKPSDHPKPWPWLIHQTICRGLELIMGCAMASITKQPSVRPRHQYFSNYRSYSGRINHRGNPFL